MGTKVSTEKQQRKKKRKKGGIRLWEANSYLGIQLGRSPMCETMGRDLVALGSQLPH